MIKTQDMRITVGQTWQVLLTFRDEKGRLVDLTGAVVKLSVTADLKVPPLFVLASSGITANGQVDIQDQSASKGQAIATTLPIATGALMPYGDSDPYFWDAVAFIGSARYPGVATSRLSVFPTVTTIP